MRLLLDTHVWLWALFEPDRLRPKVRQALRAPEHELWLSPISVWEVLLLAERKRIRLAEPLDATLDEMLAMGALREAPLTTEIARESRRVELGHRDPADRFLVATARILDLTLVTADERLLQARQVAMLSNR